MKIILYLMLTALIHAHSAKGFAGAIATTLCMTVDTDVIMIIEKSVMIY